MDKERSIFTKPLWVAVFALTAAMAWGWAYPLIKLGFAEFGITQGMVGSKMLFAGIRFFISGLIVLAVAASLKKDFSIRSNFDWTFIIAFSLVNTTFHYATFYFGLSYIEGSRAAILNALGIFLLVILACIFFESDKMTLRKVAGCCVGIAGVLILNIGHDTGAAFTFKGDGMIILNALCSAVAGLMARGLGKRIDVFVGVGYSLAIGGFLLVIPGLATGGSIPQITPQGIVILLLLITISSLSFTLYNKLLVCNPVGKIAIYNSLIPVVGAITSCIFLHEQFSWNYAVAALLATSGIYIINKGK